MRRSEAARTRKTPPLTSYEVVLQSTGQQIGELGNKNVALKIGQKPGLDRHDSAS